MPIWDFKKTMSLLCKLVRRKKPPGNFAYIKLSSGSKLSAVVGTLAYRPSMSNNNGNRKPMSMATGM